MNIGQFNKTPDGYTGIIHTLTIWESVRMVRCEKKSENAPSFRIYKGVIEIGVAWEATTNDNRPYLSVRFDDPSFPEPVYAGLFEGDRETYNLVWTRRKDT